MQQGKGIELDIQNFPSLSTNETDHSSADNGGKQEKILRTDCSGGLRAAGLDRYDKHIHHHNNNKSHNKSHNKSNTNYERFSNIINHNPHSILSDESKKIMKMKIKQRIDILSLMKSEQFVVPATRKQALRSPQWNHFENAELTELSTFNDPEMKVWELVPRPAGANVIGVRWVYDIKVDEHNNPTRYKARLVAKGYAQKEGIDYNETFAPTMNMSTSRMLVMLAATHNIKLTQYDVSTAFLHADLKEDVYVHQPEGHVVKGKEDHVYKLNKAMYGLKNAPKAYSDHFMKVLEKVGFVQSKGDDCLWSLNRGNSFIHYAYHVDDILCLCNDDDLKLKIFNTIKIKYKLKIRDEGDVSLFLGIKHIRHDDGTYSLSQHTIL
jgi:hypothetical protein